MLEFKKDVPDNFPKALGDNVVIDVSHANTGKEGKQYHATGDAGILVAKEVKHEDRIATSGYVVSCGPDCNIVKVGDRVVLPVHTQALMHFSYEGQPADRKFCRVFERNLPAVFDEE